jgi:beta-glucuronidase
MFVRAMFTALFAAALAAGHGPAQAQIQQASAAAPSAKPVPKPIAAADAVARDTQIRTALRDGGRYAAIVLLDDKGRARGDYDSVRGEWLEYEPAWHTGQVVWGLIEAHRITGDAALLAAARRGGEWWATLELREPAALAGMLNAAHGGRLGPLINFTTLSDGTPGLFALSRVTGNPRYADVATRAGDWSLRNLYLEREAMLYNIVDPKTGDVWKDRSPHHPDAKPATLTQVARPNAEGFLFLDMYRHTGKPEYRKAFLNLADGLVRRQDANGLWMAFEPNDHKTSKIHPRFNLWYAEALIEVFEETGDRRYLDAAVRTARTTTKMQREDGAIFYDNNIDANTGIRARERSLTGSAVAFAGLIWLRLRDHGFEEFTPNIERSLRWLLANRYPTNHPDPNLRGGFLETWVKNDDGATRIQVRDIATAFALRFLAAYHDRCCATSGRESEMSPRASAVRTNTNPQHIANTGASEFTLGETPTRAAQSASAPGAMVQVPGHLLSRARVDLSGTWRYIVDPFDLGRKKPHSVRRNLPKDLVAQPGGELIEYDWDQARTIRVPSDWNTEVLELEWYEGVVWYRRKFDTPKAGGRHVLYFEGANYRTEVWLNGEKLGVHDGGFTPFAFEVSGRLRASGNSLVVAVDSARKPDRIPAMDFDWFNYGGITRPVHLLSLPQAYVHDGRFWLEDTASGPVLRARVNVDGAAASVQVRIQAPELGVDARAMTDANGRAVFALALPSAFRRWSPDDPKLYAISASIDGDRIEERVGLRTLAVRGGDILLNGKPLYLEGISIHEERFGADGGRPRNAAEIEALLRAAKDLDANFVRLAHYPHSETATRLADAMGLLVWSEIPVYWEEIAYADPDVYALAERMMAANIARDFNRSSVLTWSVANETPRTAARLSFLTTLIQSVREDDPTRPVSAALNKNPEVDKTITVNDPLGEDLDLIAINTYEGWYGKRTTAQIAEVGYRSLYDKPLLFSEFGADAKRGFIGDAMQRWSEGYQAALYAQTLRAIAATPQARGISPWILKDFRSPRRFHGIYQDYWNRKGVVDEFGKRKAAFDVLRDFYRRHPQPAGSTAAN